LFHRSGQDHALNKTITITSLALLLIGMLAFFLLPIVWRQEPAIVMQVGVGAGVCAIFITSAVLILSLWLAYRRGEDQAEQRVNRERDDTHRQFLRRLDHELKNPLTGLQTAITNLRESENPEETFQAVENASLAKDRLSHILSDLRKLSQLESQLLERRPIDIGELAGEMVNAANALPAYQGRSLSLMVSKVPASPCTLGDRDMLGLALYNLIDNALKFSTPQDAIEVLVHGDGHAVFIEVADGGTGIPMEEQQRIFEDLYRGENARETEGSGLGLPLARRIIQLHGGEISLRSNPALGRGTVFIIRLPAEG
jgi:two-component system OmpR family sensor kinase